MPALLDRMNRQMAEAQERYRSLETLITGEDRDPSDVERGEMDHLRARMEELQPQIIQSVELERRLNASTEAVATLPPSTALLPRRERPSAPSASPFDAFRSWGDLARAMASNALSGDERENLYDVQARYLVEHSRALVDVTTADVPGLVPPIWLRDIADTISAAQPFVNAFSQMPLPDVGMTLSYPSITARPLVGKQVGEKTDIPSRKTTIGPNTANVSTYGGGEDVSVQVLQRTDPSYLSLMLELYAEAMAFVVDTDAIAAANTAITQTTELGAAADFTQQLAAAASMVLKASRLMPDTMVVSVEMWEAFAGAADATGRPLFPNTGPSNPVGQSSIDSVAGNARGMTFVIDPNMAPNTGIMGARQAFTSMLGPVQTLSADNVSKLGRDYAVFRFATFLTRRPDAMVKLTVGGIVP